MEFSKGTLHHMKQNTKANEPFTLYTHVEERLGEWGKVTAEFKAMMESIRYFTNGGVMF